MRLGSALPVVVATLVVASMAACIPALNNLAYSFWMTAYYANKPEAVEWRTTFYIYLIANLALLAFILMGIRRLIRDR